MLMCGDKPRAGQNVGLFGGGYSCSDWNAEKPIPLFQTSGVSDEQGKAVFEKVYPEINYVLDMKTYTTSPMDNFLNSTRLGQTKFIPSPGETSKVQVGGIGCPVIGKVAISDELQKKIQWDYAKITFSSVDPSVPKPDYKNLPIPKEIDRSDRTAVMVWYWKWIKETEEGKAFYRNENAFNMQCDEENGTCPVVLGISIDAPIGADGTFRVEDVPSGAYKVTFCSFQPKPASEIPVDHSQNGFATRDTFENHWNEPIIGIPPISGKQSNQPFDAGTLRIELWKN
jgi:hypothetical protein